MITPITDIKVALAACKKGDIVIFDLDDTVSRVPQTLGLDAWFRFTVSRLIDELGDSKQAGLMAISLYNEVQHATKEAVRVDKLVDMAHEIEQLKERDVRVIALTSRNHQIIEPTLNQLASLGISFDKEVLRESSFRLKGKRIEIKDGIIFSNGSDKGETLRRAATLFQCRRLADFSKVHFIDDGQHHCEAVANVLEQINIAHSVWHYQYAMFYHPFDEKEKRLADTQQAHWQKHGELLPDKDVIKRYGIVC